MLQIDVGTFVEDAYGLHYGLSPRRYGVVSEPIFMERTVSGLRATDATGIEILKRIGVGEMVRCEITKPRNLMHHKKFWALVNVFWAATGKWPTPYAVLLELKDALGYVDRQTLSTGRTLDMPRSISFAKMDQIAFDDFYERSLKELCEMAGGIPEEGLRQAVLEELARA